LDISVLEKIRDFSFHWVVVSEGDLIWGFEGVLSCEGGKDIV